jgi:hypothetical protein
MKRWTIDEVRRLGVRTDLVTACSIRYGVGKNRAYDMFRNGELDFPAVRVGRKVVVPVIPLLEQLGISPETSEAGASTPADAAITAPLTNGAILDDCTLRRPEHQTRRLGADDDPRGGGGRGPGRLSGRLRRGPGRSEPAHDGGT